jgi:putative DNA primase/helicase
MWNYMFQFQVPHDYDPKIRDCPAIHRFFQQVVHKNDVQAVYELFAYCLFRSNPYQKAFMLVGSGSNGKSTLLSLLNEFIGPDNSCNVEFQEFDENRFSKSRLYNKHVNFFADLPQRALKGTGIFKSITGGDFVEGEKKFKDSFSFRPFAKLVFSANMVPRSEDDTDAFYRRWVIINFPNQFEGKKIDPYLLPKLTSEPEMQGLLFRCMSILPKLLKMGFTARYTTGEMRKMYTRLSDPVGNFIDERINIQSEKWVSKKELFDRFIKYCRKGNYPIVSEKTFSKALMSMIPSIGQARPKFLDQRIRAWTGISFIVEENEEEISHQWE